jgi:hypothetical protein
MSELKTVYNKLFKTELASQKVELAAIDDINKRFKNPIELNELTDRFFSVNDGFISVKFLDEQLIEANHISKVNSENGAKGGRPKKTNESKKDK